MAEAKKKTAKKKAAKKTTKKKAAKVAPGSRGLEAATLAEGEVPAEVSALVAQIEGDGGAALATYRDPLGGNWTVLASLPVDKVAPTPFQRDLSATHVKRLTGVIDKLDRFLDPVITVHNADAGAYWTPNGNHRLNAVKNLGGKSIVALVVPDAEVAYKILALNTEKAHNVKEKSLEVIRMARSLADLDAANTEEAFALEFEEPSLLTLGACYEERARFSGSAYNPILKRIEAFLPGPMTEAIAVREARAVKLLALDDAVAAAVSALKAKGLDSPYLKNFVIARINPIRARGATGEWDVVLDKMVAAAEGFDAGRVDAGALAKAGGGGD
ncbi:MAG: ParB N-terminal domain-containing protein [Myxococcota bacterium]